MLKTLLPRAAACLAAAVISTAVSARAAAETPTVRIDNFTFGPQAVTVHAGATVTWINGDDTPHTVVAADKSFKSKVLDTNGKFAFTFATPGTYSYFCGLHPHMTGKVVVTER